MSNRCRLLWVTVFAMIVPILAQAGSSIDGTWQAFNNGYVGTLVLTVNNDGSLQDSKAFGDEIHGFWNEASGKLVFYRIIIDPKHNIAGKMNPDNIQVFTGYLFQKLITTFRLLPTASVVRTQGLAGTFESFSGTQATTQKNAFGWWAQREVQ